MYQIALLFIGGLVLLRFLVPLLILRFKILKVDKQIPSIPTVSVILGHLPILQNAMKTGLTPEQALFTILGAVNSISPWNKNGIGIVWLGPIPIVIVTRPETAEIILGSNTLTHKSVHYEFISDWLGQGLLTSNGNKWKTRRKMLTPSFHFKILEDFIPVMVGQTKILIEILDKKVDIDDGIVDDVSKLILHCALDVICETAMGVNLGAQTDENSRYVRSVHKAGVILMKRIITPWFYSDLFFSVTPTGRRFRKHLNRLHDFTDKVIRQRKKAILEAGKIPFDDMRDETGKKKRLAFMDFLIKEHLDSPEGFTERDIREEVDTFMFEGHDTTAWGISWSIYLLGLHPEKQRLVHEELDSIFGEDQEREFSQEDLRNMHYIECVVKEAQRLFPSVPVYARITTENVKVSIRSTGKVVYLPEGMNTAIFPSLVHRCPDHWEEPEKFIPERFLPENSKGRHPYAHIPFSAGPRNCIGQKFAILEEKAAIASIFRKFHVQSFDPRDKVFPIPALIFKANLPLKIKVSRRL